MSISASIIKNDNGTTTISVVAPDGKLEYAHDTHRNFDAILRGVLADDPDVISLFDLTEEVAARFQNLSDRISVYKGHICVDGDPQSGTITDHILAAVDQDVTDFMPLVNFYEKILTNPNAHSREMFFDWLQVQKGGYTITLDGDVIMYKGLDEDKTSVTGGRAMVDGVIIDGKIPNEPNTEISMPRSLVAHAPNAACSTGLHAATYDFASDFGRGPVVAIVVNPRDVVSVPSGDAKKVRVCRYRVKEVVYGEYGTAIHDSATHDHDDESVDELAADEAEPICSECGCECDPCDCETDECDLCGCGEDVRAREEVEAREEEEDEALREKAERVAKEYDASVAQNVESLTETPEQCEDEDCPICNTPLEPVDKPLASSLPPVESSWTGN